MKKNPNQSANEFYNEHHSTENYYKILGNFCITDGVKNIADQEECYWLIDIILSYQFYLKFRVEEFQVWKLKRIKNEKLKLTATDGNENILVTQTIQFSDFFFDELTIWKESNILLLPSEH